MESGLGVKADKFMDPRVIKELLICIVLLLLLSCVNYMDVKDVEYEMCNNTICNLKYRLLLLNVYGFVAICGMFMCGYSTRYCFNSPHIYIFVIPIP